MVLTSLIIYLELIAGLLRYNKTMVLTSLEVVVEPCVYRGIYCAVTEGNVGGCILEGLVPGGKLQTDDLDLDLHS